MKSREELDVMTTSQLIDYLLALSQDKKEPCIIREIARLKAIQLSITQLGTQQSHICRDKKYPTCGCRDEE